MKTTKLNDSQMTILNTNKNLIQFSLFNKINLKCNINLKKLYKQNNVELNNKSLLNSTNHLKLNPISLKPKVLKSLGSYAKINTDQYRRTGYAHKELDRYVLKALLSSKSRCLIKPNKNKVNTYKTKKNYAFKNVSFSDLGFVLPVNRKISKKVNANTRLRNRCVLTSHPTSLAKLGISRMSFRRLAGFGKLPGVFKI